MFVFWLVLGAIAAMIANSKGRHIGTWFAYGFLLAPIAIVHALLLVPDPKATEARQAAQGMKKCPYCAEMVKQEAIICRFCNRDFPESESIQGPELSMNDLLNQGQNIPSNNPLKALMDDLK
ncbi:hypothetical protein D3C86_1493980 [compost metagenome]